MVVAILHIRVGHRVRVIGVEVVAALRALKHWVRGNRWSLTGYKRSGLGAERERETESGALNQGSRTISLCKPHRLQDMRTGHIGAKLRSATALSKLFSCLL